MTRLNKATECWQWKNGGSPVLDDCGQGEGNFASGRHRHFAQYGNRAAKGKTSLGTFSRPRQLPAAAGTYTFWAYSKQVPWPVRHATTASPSWHVGRAHPPTGPLPVLCQVCAARVRLTPAGYPLAWIVTATPQIATITIHCHSAPQPAADSRTLCHDNVVE